MKIQEFGWNDLHARCWRSLAAPGTPARVRLAARGQYLLITEEGEVHAELGGRFRHTHPDVSEWPVSGDWVTLAGGGRIDDVLPRRNELARKEPGSAAGRQVLAANVDVVFIVSGLDRDFNPRRLERYLFMAWEGGVEPVLVLNKADVCEDAAAAIEQVEAVAGGAKILSGSALHGTLAGELAESVEPGRTAALLGSSGVGKSTLVNLLLGDERQRVCEVRAQDQRGRHTTTHRELFQTPQGWLLIDTPGLRELQLWGSEESMTPTFGDIADFAAHCRFRDCTHQGEPGCSVEAAIADGRLSEDRLANYQKMRRELEFLASKQDQQVELERKRKWKQLHKQFRKGYHRGRQK